MTIKGKIAIVTGASSGIGFATAQLLTKHGAKVALVSRSKDKLIRLSEDLPGSMVIPTDMTEESEILQMINSVLKHYGRIDILINNAGQGYDSIVEHINLKTFRKIINLDLIGPLIAMQSVIPIMRKNKEGSIVNISSGTSLMYLPGMSAYSSMKRALNGLTLTAREELKNDHISVSVVYPYMTKTDFEKNTIRNKRTHSNSDEDFRDLPPMDSAEYVAGLILDCLRTGKAENYAHEWMNKPQSLG